MVITGGHIWCGLRNGQEANRGPSTCFPGRRARAATARPDPRRSSSMASAAPIPNLPLFYKEIAPLNLEQHANMKVRPIGSLPEAGRTHAIPVTVDEFALVQRYYPIVFTVGGSPVPIALMGLNDGVN